MVDGYEVVCLEVAFNVGQRLVTWLVAWTSGFGWGVIGYAAGNISTLLLFAPFRLIVSEILVFFASNRSDPR